MWDNVIDKSEDKMNVIKEILTKAAWFHLKVCTPSPDGVFIVLSLTGNAAVPGVSL